MEVIIWMLNKTHLYTHVGLEFYSYTDSELLFQFFLLEAGLFRLFSFLLFSFRDYVSKYLLLLCSLS